MAKRVRSAKGEVIDFDVLMIKAQLAAKPLMVDVQQRREFVDSKENGKSINESIEAAMEVREDFIATNDNEDNFFVDPTKPLTKKRK